MCWQQQQQQQWEQQRELEPAAQSLDRCFDLTAALMTGAAAFCVWFCGLPLQLLVPCVCWLTTKPLLAAAADVPLVLPVCGDHQPAVFAVAVVAVGVAAVSAAACCCGQCQAVQSCRNHLLPALQPLHYCAKLALSSSIKQFLAGYGFVATRGSWSSATGAT
jgi:hypothetical protein